MFDKNTECLINYYWFTTLIVCT